MRESIGTYGFNCWVAEVVEAEEGMIPESFLEQLFHQISKVHHLEDIIHRSPLFSRTPCSLTMDSSRTSGCASDKDDRSSVWSWFCLPHAPPRWISDPLAGRREPADWLKSDGPMAEENSD